jgi:hypothetical protein
VNEDRKRGEEALKKYYDESKRNFPENVLLPFDKFLKIIDLKSKSYIMGLGLGIKMAEISSSEIDDAMESLAKNSKGMIPENPMVFTQAIINRKREFDWKAFKEISLATLEEAGELMQDVGKDAKAGLKGTFKVFANAKYLLPVLAVVGTIAFFKYNSLSKLKK